MIIHHEPVTTSEAVDLIGPLIEASFPDAQRVRKRVWAAPLTEEITAMVTIDHWKGAVFSIGYGVSCAWVPYSHRSGRKLEWPTTARQCLEHLWVDHFTIDSPAARRISRLNGPRRLKREARKAVAEARGRAPTWWNSVLTVEGVLVEARRQAANPLDVHSPRAGLVAAFTLARLGDLPAAQQLAAPLLASMKERSEEESNVLADLLDQTPRRFRADS